MHADRNLLWGLLALQSGVIDQRQWVDAMSLWLREPDRDLAGVVEQLRPLTPDERQRVDALLADYVTRVDQPTTAERGTAPTLAFDDPATPAAGVDVLPRRFGNYELLDKIAQGGMGIVYRARQIELDRVVAIKMILAGQFASEGEVERFRTEALAAAALQHPSIVAIHEVGKLHGQHFFSMDFVDGQSLDALVHDRPLRPRRAALYVIEIAAAIHYAHQRGVLHRDLKPANVLVDLADRVHVTDFGLAKRIDSASNLTATGAMIGTPSYMPPEQVKGEHQLLGPPTDVYALGAILYELLTTRPPFRAESPLDTFVQVVNDEPPAPRLLNPKTPRDLETICLKCLEKDASHRYSTAEALADDLRRFVAGEPIHARPIGAAGRLVRWCRRRPALASLAAALLAAVVVGFAAVTWQWRQAEENRRLAEANFAQAASAAAATIGAVDQWLRSLPPGRELAASQLRSLDQAVEVYEQLQQINRGQADSRLETAAGYRRLGNIYRNLNRPADARQAYQRANALFEQLAGEFPDVATYRLQWAESQDELGQTLRRAGRAEWRAAALAAYDAANELASSLLHQLPQEPRYQQMMARTWYNRAILRVDAGELAAAAEDFDRAFELQTELTGQHPQATEYRHELARTHLNRGSLLRRDARFDEAMSEYAQALDLYADLLAEPEQPETLHRDAMYELAVCHMNRGNALRQQALDIQDEARIRATLAAAEEDYRTATQHLVALTSNYPGVPEYLEELANCQNARGIVLALAMALNEGDADDEAQPDVVSKAWSEARETYLHLIEIRPAAIGYRQRLADVLMNLAQLEFRTVVEHDPTQGNAVQRWLDEAIGHHQHVLTEDDGNTLSRTALAQLFLTRGEVRLTSGDTAGAAADCAAAGDFESTDAESLFAILTLWSRCIEQAEADAASEPPENDASLEYADQALSFLQRHLAARKLTVDALRARPELEPLLARPAFAAQLEPAITSPASDTRTVADPPSSTDALFPAAP